MWWCVRGATVGIGIAVMSAGARREESRFEQQVGGTSGRSEVAQTTHGVRSVTDFGKPDSEV
jgi:hypothetical protein